MPNALSLLRILLIPVFLVLYLTPRVADRWAFVVLLVSGVTDVLDGFIARRFHMITDCGKLLDPLSDKLTQVAVVLALTTRYSQLIPLTVLCFLKEGCQAAGGILLLKKGSAVRGSQWFGKLSTVMFYACMLVLVLFHHRLSEGWVWLIIALSGFCMLMAFLGYLQIFIRICREEDDSSAAEEIP